MKLQVRLSIFCIIFVLYASVESATINVPADYATIQEGINAAIDGDTVILQNGTYTGEGNRDIRFHGKSVLLKKSSAQASCVINCEGAISEPHIAFIFDADEDSTTIVEDITITYSYTNVEGAIFIDGASPTIRRCLVHNTIGDGIKIINVFDSNRRVIIEDCRSSANSWHGINISNSSAFIVNSDIMANGLNGINISYGGEMELIGSTIMGNLGNGIFACKSYNDFIVRNCTVIQNLNGLVWRWNYPDDSYKFPEFGRFDRFDVSNNIIVFNDSIGIYAEYDYDEFTDSITRCNDVFGNPEGDFVGLTNFAGDEYGNISADPQFCECTHYNLYFIHTNSPCYPENNSCAVLMGAYGAGCTDVCGDVHPDGLYNILDVIGMINCLTLEKYWNFCDYEVMDVNGSGSWNILDITYLISYLYKGGPAPSCPE